MGLTEAGIQLWELGKWPIILILVLLIISLLYYFTPDSRSRSFRWLTPGALTFLFLWVLSSIALGFYISNFGNYDKLYGSLAGAIILLLWLWLTNVALLFGAELNAALDSTPDESTSAAVNQDPNPSGAR